LKRIKRKLAEKSSFYLYDQIVAIEAGFIGVLTAGVFLSTLLVETLYWFMILIACYGNIYIFKNNYLQYHDSNEIEYSKDRVV
jgi:hypothetical protein